MSAIIKITVKKVLFKIRCSIKIAITEIKKNKIANLINF